MRKCIPFAITILAATFVIVVVTGCADFALRRQSHQANNLFKFLYPEKSGHVDQPGVPVLSLPLKVGVAFVPVDRADDRTQYFTWTDDAAFSETQKMELMRQISDQFRSYPFVKSIELIPSAYLRPRGGFSNLEQIRQMYGVDVIALLSYDQVQFTEEGFLSLSYWTIVGAYVVRGEKNDTQTMLDGAVYDIVSRQLLFRAPGMSQVKGSSTIVNLTGQLRKDSERGYSVAATNLVDNLKFQLATFQERVKNSPSDYKIVHKPGYVGAGAMGPIEFSLVSSLAVGLICFRRKTKP